MEDRDSRVCRLECDADSITLAVIIAIVLRSVL